MRRAEDRDACLVIGLVEIGVLCLATRGVENRKCSSGGLAWLSGSGQQKRSPGRNR
jgi:hypothetical protein